MNITPLHQDLIPQVIALMEQGVPNVRGAYFDYWLYATLFSSSCPVEVIDVDVAGAVMAFRSQDECQWPVRSPHRRPAVLPTDRRARRRLHPGCDDKSSVSVPGCGEGVDRLGSRAGWRVGLCAAVPHLLAGQRSGAACVGCPWGSSMFPATR